MLNQVKITFYSSNYDNLKRKLYEDEIWFNTTIGTPQESYDGVVVNYDLSVVLMLSYLNVTGWSPFVVNRYSITSFTKLRR